MGRDRSGIGTGIILITTGLLFMGDRQGWVSFGHLWPLMLIVAGISTLAFGNDCDRGFDRRGRRRGSRLGGGIWLLFIGCLFLAHVNNWLQLRQSWPLFIVAAGLAMIAGGFGNARRSDVVDGEPNQFNNGAQGGGQWR